MVIEHNLEVIKTADWIIDLGPAGGDKPVPSEVEGGGEIVATGTPEAVMREARIYTARYLAPLLRREGERVATN